MILTKCTCNDEHTEHDEYHVELGEYLERLFIPSVDNCGSTIDVYSNMCFYTEHHSNREDGEHDDNTTMCHYCVLKFKQNEKGYYITEYTNGSNWNETH